MSESRDDASEMVAKAAGIRTDAAQAAVLVGAAAGEMTADNTVVATELDFMMVATEAADSVMVATGEEEKSNAITDRAVMIGPAHNATTATSDGVKPATAAPHPAPKVAAEVEAVMSAAAVLAEAVTVEVAVATEVETEAAAATAVAARRGVGEPVLGKASERREKSTTASARVQITRFRRRSEGTDPASHRLTDIKPIAHGGISLSAAPHPTDSQTANHVRSQAYRCAVAPLPPSIRPCTSHVWCRSF